MRRIHAALVAAPCGDDMYCAAAFCHALNRRHSRYLSNSLVTTLCTNKKRSNALQTAKNKRSADYGRIKIGKNFRLEDLRAHPSVVESELNRRMGLVHERSD